MVAILIGVSCFFLGAALAWLVGVRFAQANQRKQLRRKSALLSGAAQQMRAPLNDVLGLIQTLAFHADDLSPENNERIGAIAGAGANAKAVMLDVLDILDVEAGQTRIKRSIELLPEIADFIERTNRARAAKAGVKLDIDVKASARAWFLFDVLRLRQCVGAMVRQCVLQSGGGTDSVIIEALEPKKGKKMRRIAVSVADQSPGLEQETAELYFSAEEFTRNKLLMNAGASPLSLIIARMMAREMGGDLRVKSAPGDGVAFRLEIPAKFARAAHEDSRPSDLSPFDVARRLMSERTVLVVEDNSVNLRVIEAFLSRTAPKKILTAPNGEEALKILEKERCDVVLMDIQMPVMDGLTATKRIRASDTSWRNVPVIAVTAGARGDEREACARAGMNGFLSKPVSPEELYERLARACADVG
ncbi:MAG: response regulator [Amphiplicatus sp.]